MSKKEPQETEPIGAEPDQSVEVDNSFTEAPQAANLARRRALIAGLAAAPVVLSLMNRSAWAQTTVSCNLVNSFVNANYQWQSPRPANDNGTLAFTEDQYKACDKQPPT
jgi:hypothetical protein